VYEVKDKVKFKGTEVESYKCGFRDLSIKCEVSYSNSAEFWYVSVLTAEIVINSHVASSFIDVLNPPDWEDLFPITQCAGVPGSEIYTNLRPDGYFYQLFYK